MTVRDANGCTASAETTVSVGENILPIFSSYEACNGDTQIVLPTESENGITGTWLPAAVDMTTSDTYTFTPDAGFCALQTTVDVTIFDRRHNGNLRRQHRRTGGNLHVHRHGTVCLHMERRHEQLRRDHRRSNLYNYRNADRNNHLLDSSAERRQLHSN